MLLNVDVRRVVLVVANVVKITIACRRETFRDAVLFRVLTITVLHANPSLLQPYVTYVISVQLQLSVPGYM